METGCTIVTLILMLTLNWTAKSLPISNILTSTGSDTKTEVTSNGTSYSELNSPYLDGKDNADNSGYNEKSKLEILNDGPEDPITTNSVFPTAKIRVSVMRRSSRYWEPWELNRNVCPRSLCPANSELRPRGTANTVFYNGDIVLDKEYEKIIYGGDESLKLRMRYKRATTRAASRKWKDGVVPYMFAETILPKSKRAIKKAMREIENNTCIRFRKKKLRDPDFVRFISESGCWSSVGKLGGEQRLSIGSGCERVGIAIHEISHALGLWHEQARPDRDKYIKIVEENISPPYLPDFNKANKTLVTSLGYPYDYESVMHYSKKAFTNLGEITIEIIGVGKKLNMTIGQREGLSTIDIAQLRDMYNCNDKEDKNVTFCPKGWLMRKRSCYKFEDKKEEQFAGAAKHCENHNSRLLIIETEQENKLIRKILKTKYPNITTWRTAGRTINGTFSWYTSSKGKPEPMTYTNWAKKMPGIFSSMAIVRNKTTNKLKWKGVWLGSYKQMPQHAYNFICERRARRKCIPGKHKDGRDYRGTLDHTMDGITCQKWSSVYPHKHKLLPYPFEGNAKKNNPDGLGDHNYCRNPAGARKSRPWCYTTKKNYKWQYCDVSICSKKDADKVKQPKVSNKLNAEADEPFRAGDKNRKTNSTDRKNEQGKSNNAKRNNNKKNERKNRTEKNNRKKDKDNREKNRNKDNRKNDKKNREKKSNKRNRNNKTQSKDGQRYKQNSRENALNQKRN